MVGKEEIEKKAAVDGGVKVATDGMEKKQDEPMTVVLKLDLHCEGCAKKVRRSISQLEGVEKVKVDCNAKKLIVTGNVDPTRLREGVETKTKKKVDLISPQLPKKDGGSGGAATAGGDKKADDKPDQKKTEENKADGDNKKPKEADGDNKKPKEATVSTVVMKTKLHCDGCAHKIKRIIFKNFEGVHSVTTDLHKDLIMVTGTMEVEKLFTYLREKLKRGVDILPPPKKDNAAAGEKGKEVDGGDDKKEKGSGGSGGGGGGEEKKENSGDNKSEEAKVEVNKMEHHSYNSQTHYAMPIPIHIHMPMMPTYNQSYGDHDHGMMMHHQHSNTSYMVPYGHGHGAPPLPPPPTYLNMESDDMFSDENPNGCSVM